MSDNDQRPVIIKPTMDASGVRPGAEQVEKTVREMAQTVGAEGRKAGEGLGAVGEGAKKGADATVRETGRIRAALERLQAETEAGGRRNADYYERIAKLRGADVNALKLPFEAARAAEAAQKAATGSLGTIGMSAAATTAALRQVPAQFTDIVTSLASGQRPLQVFLQQGGQLKDVFGGAGAAVRALTGYVAGLITPLSVLAAGVAAVGAGWLLGAREGEEYRRALILTGNAAGVTADQLASMAKAISGGSSITQGKAAEVLTTIAKSGDVAADSLQRYTQAAIELERAGGPAAEETAKAFSDLAKDPLAASLKLTEGVRYLSVATAEQIKQLQAQGRATEAAKLAQDTYAQAIAQRTPELSSTLGLVERAWLGIKDATKAAADAALNIGRDGGLAKLLTDAEASIDIGRRLKENAGGSLLGRFGQGIEDKGTAQRDLLREQIRLTERAATAAGERARQEQAGLAWLKDSDKYLSSQAKFAAEIVRIRQLGLAAGKTESEIAERVRQTVQQTYGAKSDSAVDKDANARARALEDQARLLAELSGITGSYAKDLAALDDARRRGIVSEERYGELVRELVSRQPVLRKAAEDQKQLAEDQSRATKRAAQDFDDYLKGLDRSIAAGDKSLDQMRLELVELAAGADVRRELQLLELERLATTYDQAAAVAELNGEEQARYQRLAEQTREEIRWRRDLAAATDQNTVREANDRAAKDAARDWEKALDQVGQSLADAIFEGGKSAGQLLQDYFRTLILQPIVRALINPIAGAVGGSLGLAGTAASAATGGGAGGGGLGGIGNLLSLAGGATGAFGATLGAGAAATLGGTSLGSLFGAAGAAISNGAIAAGVGLGVGAAIPYVGAAVAAYYVGKKLFGKTLDDSGVQGTFSNSGFSGQTFESYKRIIGNDTTKRQAITGPLDQVFDAGALAARESIKSYADALGLPVEAIAGYTQKIKFSTKGQSDKDTQAEIERFIGKYAEGLAGVYKTQIAAFQKTGESLTQTLQRLTGLQTFSATLNALGGVFERVAKSSVSAREELIQMAGGMDALGQQTLSYTQNYYSRDEIAGLKAREVNAALGSVGVNAGNLSTRDQFRQLVDSTDVSTTAGRQQLAQLLAVGDEFAQIADYLAEAGGTLSSASALAPSTGALAELFSQPAKDQVAATDRVAGWTQAVYQAVTDLTAVVKGSTASAKPVKPPPEVNVGYWMEPTGGA
jgi:phage-related minor tail protein